MIKVGILGGVLSLSTQALAQSQARNTLGSASGPLGVNVIGDSCEELERLFEDSKCDDSRSGVGNLPFPGMRDQRRHAQCNLLKDMYNGAGCECDNVDAGEYVNQYAAPVLTGAISGKGTYSNPANAANDPENPVYDIPFEFFLTRDPDMDGSVLSGGSDEQQQWSLHKLHGVGGSRRLGSETAPRRNRIRFTNSDGSSRMIATDTNLLYTYDTSANNNVLTKCEPSDSQTEDEFMSNLYTTIHYRKISSRASDEPEFPLSVSSASKVGYQLADSQTIMADQYRIDEADVLLEDEPSPLPGLNIPTAAECKAANELTGETQASITEAELTPRVLWELAALGYKDTTIDGGNRLNGAYTVHSTCDAHNAHAKIIKKVNVEDYTVAIGGTEALELTDWLQDLDTTIYETHAVDRGNVKVHRGFWNHQNQIKDCLFEKLASLPARTDGSPRLNFDRYVGHSLGGAAATILSLVHGDAKAPREGVFTFGAPATRHHTIVRPERCGLRANEYTTEPANYFAGTGVLGQRFFHTSDSIASLGPKLVPGVPYAPKLFRNFEHDVDQAFGLTSVEGKCLYWTLGFCTTRDPSTIILVPTKDASDECLQKSEGCSNLAECAYNFGATHTYYQTWTEGLTIALAGSDGDRAYTHGGELQQSFWSDFGKGFTSVFKPVGSLLGTVATAVGVPEIGIPLSALTGAM